MTHLVAYTLQKLKEFVQEFLRIRLHSFFQLIHCSGTGPLMCRAPIFLVLGPQADVKRAGKMFLGPQMYIHQLRTTFVQNDLSNSATIYSFPVLVIL